jgi:hypothetical protein
MLRRELSRTAWQRAEELVRLIYAKDFQKSEIELILTIREV